MSPYLCVCSLSFLSTPSPHTWRVKVILWKNAYFILSWGHSQVRGLKEQKTHAFLSSTCFSFQNIIRTPLGWYCGSNLESFTLVLSATTLLAFQYGIQVLMGMEGKFQWALFSLSVSRCGESLQSQILRQGRGAVSLSPTDGGTPDMSGCHLNFSFLI